jgi:hypothetical protein
MPGVAKQRLQIAERLFDAYDFEGWDLEQVSHWHASKNELCRCILVCGTEVGAPCMRGEFVVRFKAGSTLVEEQHATLDGCFIGRESKVAVRKAG